MNLKIEEILILIVAFVIGWFLRTMISGSSLGSSSIVKAVGGKHASSTGGCIKETFWERPGRAGNHENRWHCPGSVFTFPLDTAGLTKCKADCSK
jgi:hypothetical protein